MSSHHVADQSSPRGQAKLTLDASLKDDGAFEGTIGLSPRGHADVQSAKQNILRRTMRACGALQGQCRKRGCGTLHPSPACLCSLAELERILFHARYL